MQLQIQAQEAMNERLKERLPDVAGGKLLNEIISHFVLHIYEFYELGIEPIYANASRDARVALIANAQNAENNRSISFLSVLGNMFDNYGNISGN